MAEGKAFDSLDPKKAVTDPLGHGQQTAYPKHLHKAGVADDGGPVFLEVRTAQEEADAVADGWLLEKPAADVVASPKGPAPIRKRA